MQAPVLNGAGTAAAAAHTHHEECSAAGCTRRQESIRTAFLLCQGGEFAFVLLSLAAQLKVLPDELNRLLIIVVVLSMALTPALAELGVAVANSASPGGNDQGAGSAACPALTRPHRAAPEPGTLLPVLATIQTSAAQDETRHAEQASQGSSPLTSIPNTQSKHRLRRGLT